MSEYEKIRDLILKHKGKANAISSKEIAKIVGIKAGASTVSIRGKITETIIKYAIPIGSSGKGYFLITNKDELRDYFVFLENKILGNISRKALINSAYFRYYKDEELGLTGEIIEPEDEDDDEE